MTFEFDADGFLTGRRSELETGLRAAHESLFARATQVNRDCHELLFGADIHNRAVREILVATLFTRVLEHYQAAILLLGMGVIAPAKVAIRSALEAVFATRAVADHDDALRAFIDDDLLQRRRLIRGAQVHDHTNLQELRGSLTDAIIRDLEDEIRSSGVEALTTKRLSEFAGMYDWYTTAYAILSKATHTHVRELDKYLVFEDSGAIRSIKYAPSGEEIPDLLLTVGQAVLFAAGAFCRVFEANFDAKGSEHLRFIEAELEALGEGRRPE
jgi:Family of unknown function (DUF5677)